MFCLEFDENEYPIIKNNNVKFKISDFISALLSHYFCFCQFYQYKKQQDIRIRFFPVAC